LKLAVNGRVGRVAVVDNPKGIHPKEGHDVNAIPIESRPECRFPGRQAQAANSFGGAGNVAVTADPASQVPVLKDCALTTPAAAGDCCEYAAQISQLELIGHGGGGINDRIRILKRIALEHWPIEEEHLYVVDVLGAPISVCILAYVGKSGGVPRRRIIWRAAKRSRWRRSARRRRNPLTVIAVGGDHENLIARLQRHSRPGERISGVEIG